MCKDLSAGNAVIFRIVHRDNIARVFDHGLHCRSSNTVDPQYVSIGNSELIAKRKNHPVPCPPGGLLGDYVPFYFTPFSPMLYNIKTGWGDIRKRGNDEIVILVSSLHLLRRNNVRFLFTDRHASLALAQFYSDLAKLDRVDWSILQKRDFKRNADDPGKLERYQAEALVHRHLPVDALLIIACYNDSVAASLKRQATQRKVEVAIATKPAWHF